MFFGPILSKFIELTFVAMLKWVGGKIFCESGRVRSLSFVGGGFGKLKVLILVGGIGSLEHLFGFEVDGVKSKVDQAVGDVIGVLDKFIHLFLDPPWLQVVEVNFIFGMALFVSLVHQVNHFAFLDFFHEVRQHDVDLV